MLKAIQSYFLVFLHPFLIQDFYEHGTSVRGYYETDLVKLKEKEMLRIAWSLNVLKGLGELLLTIILLKIYYSYTFDGESEFNLLFDKSPTSIFKFVFVNSLTSVLFFPFYALFFIKIWKWIINFYSQFTDVDEEEAEKMSEEIASLTLCSHGLTFIPFLGAVIQKISFFLILFAGLKTRLKLGNFTALFIIFSPPMLLSAVIISIAMAIGFSKLA